MNRHDLSEIENTLVQDAVGEFDDSELEGLPDPVQHFLQTAIAPGTPLSRTARLRMRGHINVGRWLPFRAREVLSPSGDSSGPPAPQGSSQGRTTTPRDKARWTGKSQACSES